MTGPVIRGTIYGLQRPALMETGVNGWCNRATGTVYGWSWIWLTWWLLKKNVIIITMLARLKWNSGSVGRNLHQRGRGNNEKRTTLDFDEFRQVQTLPRLFLTVSQVSPSLISLHVHSPLPGTGPWLSSWMPLQPLSAAFNWYCTLSHFSGLDPLAQQLAKTAQDRLQSMLPR